MVSNEEFGEIEPVNTTTASVDEEFGEIEPVGNAKSEAIASEPKAPAQGATDVDSFVAMHKPVETILKNSF